MHRVCMCVIRVRECEMKRGGARELVRNCFTSREMHCLIVGSVVVRWTIAQRRQERENSFFRDREKKSHLNITTMGHPTEHRHSKAKAGAVGGMLITPDFLRSTPTLCDCETSFVTLSHCYNTPVQLLVNRSCSVEGRWIPGCDL